MSIFATVLVDNSIELPHFPEELNRDKVSWQSKRGLDIYGGPYRITASGTLEEQKRSARAKTAEEKQSEASRWGFDSWDEMVEAYDNSEQPIPDAVEYDEGEEYPPTYVSDTVIDEKWWDDISYDGTFEFYHILKEDPTEYEEFTEDGEVIHRQPQEYALDVFLEYEARFDRGELSEIVFMGSRNVVDGPIEHALDSIESWRKWKAQQ